MLSRGVYADATLQSQPVAVDEVPGLGVVAGSAARVGLCRQWPGEAFRGCCRDIESR